MHRPSAVQQPLHPEPHAVTFPPLPPDPPHAITTRTNATHATTQARFIAPSLPHALGISATPVPGKTRRSTYDSRSRGCAPESCDGARVRSFAPPTDIDSVVARHLL